MPPNVRTIKWCDNCQARGELCVRCGLVRFDGEASKCNGGRPHEWVVCPECGGKGRLESLQRN